MNSEGPSRVEAYASLGAVILVIVGATLTLWGKVAALEQRVMDMDEQRVVMQQSLNRIEERLYTIKK